MLDSRNAFVTPSFLRSVWADDFAAYVESGRDVDLLQRLRQWAERIRLNETAAQPAFIDTFFRSIWGYVQPGQPGSDIGYTLRPQFAVRGAGAGGGVGQADLALGYFGQAATDTPQALCEYKGIRTNLDAEQSRKGNSRSPVQQALDYLSHARKGFVGSEPQVPTWAIVTDMNEFRLYWYDRGRQQYVGFVIEPRTLFDGAGLLADTEAAQFDRFLFATLFHRDTLLSRAGPSALLRLIHERRFHDRAIEDAFYKKYCALREHLYTELLARNGEGTRRFPGTRGRLVRLAQKILDRLLFVFFCEDMGQRLAFPPKMLQDFLVRRAGDPYFDAGATTIWQDLLRLFRAMNEGTAFGGTAMHCFNGGLFAPDPALEALEVPNGVFCQHLQGQDEASIAAHALTVLHLCATYNYAADLGEGGTRGERESLGLYTLGRIFEQSITELEIREAEVDDRPSVNLASQRKRDGVYYTPEWVVERVVDGTLGPVLAAMRQASGYDGEAPTAAQIDAYTQRLRGLAVLDPACGSGAFLITALRYLEREWRRVWDERARVAGRAAGQESEADVTGRLLRECIFGIDINPASVEIAQLALWLHTARADQPLSSLDQTVRCGNSLVTEDFYRGIQSDAFDESGRERVNAFDWRQAFPTVAARGGFDAVIGNPPYVKLQNFRPAHPDVAKYLVDGRPGLVPRPFRSTRTGNFDLYLPFIEQGLAMLNEAGRLGYIAPSLWTVNEYGAGLRELVAERRSLDRWLDFRSFQVFEEATTYTALQFFARAPTEAVCVAQAPRGAPPPDPWAEAGKGLAWDRVAFGERWLLLTGPERTLIDRLAATCARLDDPALTETIFVGVQTSADEVYHLRRLGPGRYVCSPRGKPRRPPYEVQVEDAIMRPLVSGAEAKRYVSPRTDTWLLFPYRPCERGMELIPPEVMERAYPKAWAYLQSYRDRLRHREGGVQAGEQGERPFDDAHWYRFGRNQNIDKQDASKLIVAQTVPSLRLCFDEDGAFALNNVRVNGILPAAGVDLWFLLGVLNAPVADFVFRRIAKPKDAGWFEANRQFIAPLPIPRASLEQQAAIAHLARRLQFLHTLRRDLLARIARRLDTMRARPRPASWLFPGLGAAADADAFLAERYATLDARLSTAAALDAELRDGELLLLADGVPIIDRVFVEPREAAFLLAQWRLTTATFRVPERSPGAMLATALRRVTPMDNAPAAQQVVAVARTLRRCDTAIAGRERRINQSIYELYGLTDAERAMVDADRPAGRACFANDGGSRRD